ncbi:hypothetical protein PE066_05235 [Ramlibacter tataouinensis]|uniref:hypothetical protein n=1 Tax=Ramlibacter tataouinensis TaxID=94132 RepID=UPI0022F39679|nr:hypothetical protein [Ramlibacter tataouinensis]WBY02943.1 hypothetical protein PE066_05235 [Ramlibacter tataouinensis]
MEPIRPQRHDIDRTTSWGKDEYTDWMDESMSWKTTCYVGDWSWLPELNIWGPDAQRFLSDFTVNSMAAHEIGQAKHAIFCSKEGKVIGEGVLARLGEQEFELNASGPVNLWLQYNLERGNYKAQSQLRREKTKVQVSGPNALYLLEKLTRESLRDIRFMRFRIVPLAGCDVAFLRQGMAGEIGFELHGPLSHLDAMLAAIMEAGQEFGIRRLGSRTALINHLEAGFPTVNLDYLPATAGAAEREFFEMYNTRLAPRGTIEWRVGVARVLKVRGSFDGDDVSAWYRSPVELGWGRNVKLDHDFWGRTALEAELQDPKRTIVSLVWNAEDVQDVCDSYFSPSEQPYEYMDMPRSLLVCSYASKVIANGREVGVATSRGYSFYYRKMISHCVIDLPFAEPGTEVTVIWGEPHKRQKEIRAVVHTYPFKRNANRETDLTKLPAQLAR